MRERSSMRKQTQKRTKILLNGGPFHVRIISRINGCLVFGNLSDKESWGKTYDEILAIAKERVSLAKEPLDKLQVLIKNSVTEEVRFNDKAANLFKRHVVS